MRFAMVGTAHLQARDLDHGQELGNRSVDILARAKSSRASDYIRGFNAALVTWRREPAVRESLQRTRTPPGNHRLTVSTACQAWPMASRSPARLGPDPGPIAGRDGHTLAPRRSADELYPALRARVADVISHRFRLCVTRLPEGDSWRRLAVCSRMLPAAILTCS